MATHNGSDTIERALEAFSRLDPPAGGWKFVVVDNASSDETPRIIEDWRTRLPMEVVLESRLGKNAALNAGLSKIEGDLTIITDDDVIPEKEWLVQWRRAADLYQDFSVFGGAIIPQFAVPPPRWLKSEWISHFYAATDPKLHEGEISPDHIFGLNMAVRSAVIEAGARFDETLLIGLSGLLGDETDFCRRAVANGHRACFVPKAILRHIVQERQVSWSWMLHRVFRQGRTTLFFEARDNGMNAKCIFNIPRYLLRQIAELSLHLPYIALTFSKFRLFSHLRLFAYNLGAIYQARLMLRANLISRS